MEEFDTTNETVGSFVTSVYLLGYAFGPLVLAPLSELYGRVIIYNLCNLIFLVFNIACAKAPSMNSLIVFRLFAGFAGSCPLTLGAASIVDMIALENRGKAMAGWVLGPLIGPVVGPISRSRLETYFMSCSVTDSLQLAVFSVRRLAGVGYSGS